MNKSYLKQETNLNDTGSGDYIQGEIKQIQSEMTEIEEFPEINIYQKCLPYLYGLRDPVAEYQTKKGIKKDESYTFYDLVTAVGQYMYNSVAAMGKMVSNLLPIFDAVLLIARFILDKCIDIMESPEKDRLKKATIFLFEFIPIFFIVGFIYGFIFMPLYALFTTVMFKLWNFMV